MLFLMEQNGWRLHLVDFCHVTILVRRPTGRIPGLGWVTSPGFFPTLVVIFLDLFFFAC